MDTVERKRISNKMKAIHDSYLKEIENIKPYDNLKIRFNKMRRKIQSLVRKIQVSNNSFKEIASIARVMFGIHQDILRLGIVNYDFKTEKEIVNKYFVNYLTHQKDSKYSGKCPSFGETLLNCYLDIFITATVSNTEKKIGSNPTYLVNPSTGALLEIDVLFEDFRLGFEFQGEHHYTDTSTQLKDTFKLSELPAKNRILIPVNVSQLNGDGLQKLIANSIKDYLELNDLFAQPNVNANNDVRGICSSGKLLRFSKIVQRLYLSKILFTDTLNWLDNEASDYIQNSILRNPSGISNNNPAPRFKNYGSDFDIECIYKNLKHLTQIRKNRNRLKI